MDSSKHLNVDKLPQKVGARAYLTNVGAGYLSSSDDDNENDNLYDDRASSFYSPSQAPQPPRHRIQSYTNKTSFRPSRNLRKNHSAADSVGTTSLLNEIIGNYNQDRDFSRKLESEFGRIKKQDECKRGIKKSQREKDFRSLIRQYRKK